MVRQARHNDERVLELRVTVHVMTAAAVFVSTTGDRRDGKWLPRSQIEIAQDKGGGRSIVTLPEWLAIEKGLENED